MALLVRNGGSRHTGLAAPPHKNIQDIRDKKILDVGSGIGVTANYLAEHNDVTVIEPDEDSIKERWAGNQYTQVIEVRMSCMNLMMKHLI